MYCLYPEDYQTRKLTHIFSRTLLSLANTGLSNRQKTTGADI